MKYSHRSPMIDKYLGHKVKICFRNGTEEVGMLHSHIFDGYLLKCLEYDVRFYKSSVKTIELMREKW